MSAPIIRSGIGPKGISPPILYLGLFLLPVPIHAMANLVDNGEDFSNNLASDIAPLLALFGEQVTKQFMSESTGWADCIMLAMAPLGVITILVSAIRVGGFRWLRALIGRSTENLVAVELEVMSCTSNESCELWNGQTVVRCPGTADICEFICLYPLNSNLENIQSVRIMDMGEAISNSKLLIRLPEYEVLQRLRAWIKSPRQLIQDTYDKLKAISKRNACCDLESALKPGRSSNAPKTNQPAAPTTPEPRTTPEPLRSHEIVIIRNRDHHSPNITLNCQIDKHRWSLWSCAVFGVLLQGGVLVFWGMMTEYHTLKFEKDGEPVEKYAMPLSVTGTLLLVFGMLICGHVVDRGSRETVYEVLHVEGVRQRACAMSMIWLQKEKTVSDQRFESAIVYSGVERLRALTSARNGNHSESPAAQCGQSASVEAEKTGGTKLDSSTSDHKEQPKQSDTTGQGDPSRGTKLLTTFGALISVFGIGGQFTGLRGMHWLASITQLAASILMTFLRAVVRRYLSQPPRGERVDPGFEIEWFITSLNNLDTASWLPSNRSDKALLINRVTATKVLKNMFDIFSRKNEKQNGKSQSSQNQVFVWRILSESQGKFSWGKTRRQHSLADSRAPIRHDGKGQSPDAREQNFIDQPSYFEVKNFKTNEGILELRRSLGELGNWKGPAYAEALSLSRAIEAVIDTFAPYIRDIGDETCCHWTVEAFGANGGPDTIEFHLDKTPEGWRARTDELDSALSLWLYSVDDTKKDTPSSRFPSRRGNWARDRKSRHRCVQILGSYSNDLIRDLNWWMPNGLEGILEGQTIIPKDSESSQHDTEPINEVYTNRIGRSGLRHLSSDDTTKFHDSMWTSKAHSHSESQSQSISWKWKDVQPGDPLQSEKVKDGGFLLLVEFQDSLASLYAKDLLSSFMWAFASHLKPFTVGRHLKATIESPTTERLPKSFALRSDELSHLVRRIASSTAWTEREIYLCVLPPLSSKNNLPGVHAIVERALETVARDERDQNWLWVWEAYNWLFETCFKYFDPAHPVYLEAVAITLWFKEKVGQLSVRELSSDHDNQYISDELRGVRKKFEAFSDRLDPRFSATSKRLWDLIRLCDRISPVLLIPDVEDHDTIWDDLEDLRFDSLSLTSPEYIRSFARPEDRRDVFWDTQLHRLMSSDMGERRDVFPNNLRTRKAFWETFKGFSSSFEEIVESLEDMTRNAFDNDTNPISFSDARTNEKMLLEQAKGLLEGGLDPNILDMKHWTALHHACELILPKQLTWRQQRLAPRPALGQNPTSDGVVQESRDIINMEEFYVRMAIEKVEVLLDKKANINAQSLDGRTPLHCATRSGCKELVLCLINRDADRTLADVHGHTPFHLAAIGNNTSMLLSLRLKADDFTNGPRDLAGRTALHLAAMAGSIDAMKTLLGLVGVRDGALDNQRRTPLHLASLFGKDEAVKVLLARGEVTWSAKDYQGRTPIHLGALSGAATAVELLMEHERKYHERNSQEAEQNPVWFTDLVSFSKDSNLQTPFHLAAKGGKIWVLLVMVLEMGRMNIPGEVIRRALLQQDINGETAFMVAMGEQKIQPAELFLALAADGPHGFKEDLLEATTTTGETALTVAVRGGFLDGVELLLDHQANLDVRCSQGMNLFHYAVKAGNIEIADMIAQRLHTSVAMWKAADEYGKAPIDYAEDDQKQWAEFGANLNPSIEM